MIRLIFITSIAIAIAGAASACTTPFPSTMGAAIPQKPDQRLFSEAVLIATNNARCRQGETQLRHDNSLRKASFVHSRNMVATGTFSHKTRISGAATLKDRAKMANVRFRYIAENLALLSAYQFTAGKPFQVENRAACKFRSAGSGAAIPIHSYKTLAEEAVQQWMGSPGHRKNLLSGRLDRLGAAAVFAPTETCGQYYITQVFAD
ncbi:MAG: CAP domain-containing protein [Pseudomonadota bacterium]